MPQYELKEKNTGKFIEITLSLVFEKATNEELINELIMIFFGYKNPIFNTLVTNTLLSFKMK